MKIDTKQVTSKSYIAIKEDSTLSNMHEFVEKNSCQLYSEAEDMGLTIIGPIEFIYKNCTGNPDEIFELMLALPIKEKIGEPKKNFYYDEAAYVCAHKDFRGSMKILPQGWHAFYDEVRASDYEIDHRDISKEIYKGWVSFESDKNSTELQIILGK